MSEQTPSGVKGRGLGMGSINFTEAYWGPETAADAHRKLCDQARYEFGVDGYNGTISTTWLSGVHQSQPVRLTEAEQITEALLDRMSKGDCIAIPLLKVTQRQSRLKLMWLRT